MDSIRNRSARLLVVALAAVMGLGVSGTPAALAAGQLAVMLSDAKLDDIVITPSPLELGPGESVQLTATGYYDDDTTADVTNAVDWTTRDDDVVVVSAAGVVTAVGAGETEIECEEPVSGRGASRNGEVLVAEIDSISISPATATMEEGATRQLTARATLTNGRTGFDVTEVVQWTSGKVSTATVSDAPGSKGRVTALNKGEAVIRAKDLDSGNQSSNDEGVVTVVEGGSATPTPAPGATPTPADLDIHEINLVPLELKMLPGGDTSRIQAIATLSDGSTRDVSNEMEWESNREHIAGVSGSGQITSGEPGDAEIDAHHPASGKNVRDHADIWVGEIENISISPPGAHVAVGGTVQLSAIVTYDNGLTGDITTSATWHSEKDRVAMVSDNFGSKGLVTGIDRGDAVIVATDPVSGEKSDTTSGRVLVDLDKPSPTPVPGEDLDIDELHLEPLHLNLAPGRTATIRAIATLDDGSVLDVTDQCIFESDDERYVTVAGAGLVTGHESGRTKVDAYHPATGTDARREAEVWVGEVESIDISPSGAILSVGDTIQLSALATYDNGLNEDISDIAEWSSEKTRVATVSDSAGSKGFVTGVSRGDAVIVARDAASGKRSKSSSGLVEVQEQGETDPGDVGTDPSYTVGLEDIVIDPLALNLMPGETAFVTATGIYEDGSTRDLTEFVEFEARRESTASVDESGAVTAHLGGDTEIRVTEPLTGVRSRVSARVHVAEMTSLEIWPPVRILVPGQVMQLLAFAAFDNGVTDVDVTDEVKWSSSRSNVAEVETEAPNWGLLTAYEIGETDIIVEHRVADVKSDRDEGRVEVAEVGAPTPVPTPAPTPGPTPEPGSPVEVIGHDYAPDTIVLQDDGSAQIVTTARYSDGSTQTVTGGLEYDSDDYRVAVVDDHGRVVARGTGTTTIRITDLVDGFDGEVTVIVREVTSLVISPASIGLRVGASQHLKAFATFSDGTSDADVTSAVEWRSTNPFVVSVNETGRVTANAVGTARIEVLDRVTRARSDASSGIVQVVGSLVNVFLTPSRLAMQIGEEKNYKAYGVFSDGSTVQITEDVLWSVDAGLPPRVTISETGRVTAHALGDAMVHATDLISGISSAQSGGSREVSVVGDLLGIRVSTSSDIDAEPSDVNLSAGETKSLKGLAQFEGRTDGFSMGSALDWWSSDPTAVSVNGSGLVTCHSVGVSIISATDPDTGISSTDTLGDLVVICAGQVVSVRTTPDFRDLDYLGTRQLRAFRMLEDGSEIEVTRKVVWTSSDPSIVSIVETGSEGGLATALGDGQATLYAFDAAFGVSSADSGQVSVIRTRKTRVLLEIFPENDAIGFTGNVGATYGFQARVTYASGATQGVNLLLDWDSSNPGVVLMGDGTPEFKVNQAHLLSTGTATITGTYPADEASANQLRASVLFQVQP